MVRDDSGNQLATDTLSFAANGDLAFTLGTDKYPQTANLRGTIEFAAPADVHIGVIGIRRPPALTYTSLPALAKSPASGSCGLLRRVANCCWIVCGKGKLPRPDTVDHP